MEYVTSFERLAKQEGREEGLAEGREEGREEGMALGALRIATRLLRQNLPVDFVSQVTDLPPLELNAIKEGLEKEAITTAE